MGSLPGGIMNSIQEEDSKGKEGKSSSLFNFAKLRSIAGKVTGRL